MKNFKPDYRAFDCWRPAASIRLKQLDFVEREAARLGITISESIRRIVDQYREDREPK
jgi:hypothetical protein